MRRYCSVLGVWAMCAAPLLAQSASTPSGALPGIPAAAPTEPCAPMVPEAAPTAPCGCFYSEVDYLLWWFKPICLNVPVITVGPTGVVGQPGTRIVVGGDPPHKFDFGATSGGQVKAGWNRGDGLFGVEVSGFLMDTASASQGFVASPNGSPASFLPYQDPANIRMALPFTVPGVVTGSSIAIGSTHVWGVESNLTLPLTVDLCGYSVVGKLLLGARYLDLTDRDRIQNSLSLVANPSAFAIGADQVITRNQFYGPQVGSTLGVGSDRWSVDGTLKLAAGLTHQARNIEGSPLLVSSVSSPLLVPGPLIALPSNIGRETADRVTLVPEIGLTSRLALTSWCSVTVGYSLIYWNKVLCPGDQMDPLVNISQLPFHGPVSGSLVPAPLFVHTDYFAQGLDLGVQFRF